MSFLKYFYPPTSMKRKLLFIEDDIKEIVKKYSSEKLSIDWYGVHDVEPTNMFFCVCVETDKTRNQLKNDFGLHQKLKNILAAYDYAKDVRGYANVGIDFESQETVDRDSLGNWFYHFK